MCFANYHNHFGDMRVFLNFGVFYEEDEAKKEKKMDKEVLNSALSNIKVPNLIVTYPLPATPVHPYIHVIIQSASHVG